MKQVSSAGSLVVEGARVVGSNLPSSNRVLVWSLWTFAAVALIFEPMVFFGCLSGDGISVAADWRISNCALKSSFALPENVLVTFVLPRLCPRPRRVYI